MDLRYDTCMFNSSLFFFFLIRNMKESFARRKKKNGWTHQYRKKLACLFSRFVRREERQRPPNCFILVCGVDDIMLLSCSAPTESWRVLSGMSSLWVHQHLESLSRVELRHRWYDPINEEWITCFILKFSCLITLLSCWTPNTLPLYVDILWRPTGGQRNCGCFHLSLQHQRESSAQ